MADRDSTLGSGHGAYGSVAGQERSALSSRRPGLGVAANEPSSSLTNLIRRRAATPVWARIGGPHQEAGIHGKQSLPEGHEGSDEMKRPRKRPKSEAKLRSKGQGAPKKKI